jgi:hypothetical protein
MVYRLPVRRNRAYLETINFKRHYRFSVGLYQRHDNRVRIGQMPIYLT